MYFESYNKGLRTLHDTLYRYDKNILKDCDTRKIGTLKRTCVYCALSLSKIEMNLAMQKPLNDLFLE